MNDQHLEPVALSASAPTVSSPGSAPKVPHTASAPRGQSAADVVFAWLCFLFGYLFCRVVPVFENPLGGFGLILTVFITTFVILKIKKVKMTAVGLMAAVSALVVSGSLVVSGDAFLVFLAYTYAAAAYGYFVYAACGNTLERGFSDFVFIDYFKALFLFPFRSFVEIYPVLFRGKGQNGAKLLAKILIGIAFATVPTVIVLMLLSYDEGFMSILKQIFTIDIADVFSHIFSLLFAVPVGMYLFGLYASSVNRRLDQTITAEGCRKVRGKIRVLPQVTALTATLPILFLYVVFFVSQWPYYVSSFTGALPEEFSYAEYARQGFFQLCAVSVINLIIIMILVLFVKGKEGKASPVLKLLTSVFCVSTLVLISTAVAKLVMYIDYYGLTQKRLYAMWLMIVIALVFVVIAMGQFVSRVRVVASSALVLTVLFAALSLCNVNEITASYNVDRYVEGTLETVDLEAMEQLGDCAVPSLVRLAEVLETQKEDDELQLELTRLLSDKVEEMEDENTSIFAFNLPAYKARMALDAYAQRTAE